MLSNSKIYIAGHRGMVGSAMKRSLESKGYTNFILRTHKDLDLTNQKAVNEFFNIERPNMYFLPVQKLVEFLPIADILPNSYMKT
jgi:GDP-L-fucose synthase